MLYIYIYIGIGVYEWSRALGLLLVCLKGHFVMVSLTWPIKGGGLSAWSHEGNEMSRAGKGARFGDGKLN